MEPQFKVGQQVEFVNSRFEGEEHRYEPYNKKYRKGTKGFVISINETTATPEYTVKVGVGNVIEVPETDLSDPNKSMSEKVEEKLRKDQEHRQYKDTAFRVGGSRKEKAAYKTILVSDLQDIEKDEATAIELIKKDKVYPKVDVAIDMDKGVSAGASYLKTQLRKVFGAKPANNPHIRKIYVGYAEYLVNKFDEITTVADFEAKTQEVQNEAITTFLLILDPELIKRIEKEEENKEATTSMLKNQYDIAKKQYDDVKHKIEAKGMSVWNLQTEDPLQREYTKAYTEMNEAERKYRDIISSGYLNEVEKEFLEKIKPGNSFESKYGLSGMLIEEIFGKRFYNFIYNRGKSANNTYHQAKDYEGLSEEKSKELIKKNTSRAKESIIENKKAIAMLESEPTIKQLDKYFIEEDNDNTGYYGADRFGRRKKRQRRGGDTAYYYYEDAKASLNQDIMDWFIRRVIESKKRRIEVSEEQLKKISYKYRQRENDWSWAGKKSATGKKETTDLRVNQGIPLSYIKRTGGLEITEDDVTVAAIQELFGFRAVEFGKYIKDSDAKEHIRHFLGAIADMGEMLEMDIIQLNNYGGLSIAFGSRGHGRAAAHYEPLRKIINLTKSGGDGSVAHEYCHYIDNIIPKIGREKEYQYTDNASVIHKARRYSSDTGIRSEAVNDAMHDIFKYIYEGSADGEPAIIKQTITAQHNKSFGIPSTEGYTDIEDYWKMFTERYKSYAFIERQSKRDKDIIAYIVGRFGHTSYELEFKTRQSAYYANCKMMKSKYWSQPWELFARAFETYMFDKLEKAGRTNNYLVSGGYFERAEGVYPQGKDRSELFALYDTLFKTMKTEYQIPGFKKFTEQRTDEYIDLDENSKEEKVTAGVIVDAKTGEVEDRLGKSADIRARLLELAEMLAAEKMEKGGSINNKKIVEHLIDYAA